MKVLSGIIGPIVRPLTKVYPEFIEGRPNPKTHIGPDKQLIRVVVHNTNLAWRIHDGSDQANHRRFAEAN
jgi:hypothetical protein